MNPFKAYDIRGIYGADIDQTLAFRAGRAFAQHTAARACSAATTPAPTPPSC